MKFIVFIILTADAKHIGLFESQINIEGIFHIGSAQIITTQQHIHCYRLGTKFARMNIVQKNESDKSGIYF